MSSFVWGFRCYLSGLTSLFQKRELRPWIIAPMLIGIICFGLAIWGTYHFLTPMVLSWLGTGVLASILAAILVIVISGALTLAFASVVASPMNALLSEKVLVSEGYKAKSSGFRFLIFVRMLLLGLLKGVFVLGLTVLLFILSFFPPLQVVVIFISAMLISSDYFDYALECYEVGLGGRSRFYRRQILSWCGFSLGLALTMMVPGLSFLLLPAGIIGGARLVGRYIQQQGDVLVTK